MMVCICNAIRERQVRDAVRQGACDPCGAYATLGFRPKCGKCLPYAKQLIAAERAHA